MKLPANDMRVSWSFLSLIWWVIGVQGQNCKCAPGDSCWPSDETWASLNASVNGNLIKTVPIGAPCHDPTYDAEACANVQNEWLQPSFHINSSSSIMSTYYTNDSCNPFQPRTSACTLGTYVRYAINVTDEKDVQAGLKFAHDHNIRLVIRNTGHEYNGKSTGFGSLSLWLHYVKGSKYEDYKSEYYTGPAVRLSAGDQVEEVYDFLEPRGYMAVGGECPTVGIAGGYIAAGGHSALSSILGLAADQTLEFAVFLANGTLVTASPTLNEDLYWALSGGGGGTFGVVWSITVRIFHDVPVSGSNLTVPGFNYSDSRYWSVLEAWHDVVPAITDAGAYAWTTYSPNSFSVAPLFGPNLTATTVQKLLAPIVETLKQHNMSCIYNTTSYINFNTAYKALFPFFPAYSSQFGSRLMPRDVFEGNKSLLSSTVHDFLQDNAYMLEIAINPAVPRNRTQPSNAVLPAWRKTDVHMIATLAWNDTAPFANMVAQEAHITDVFLPKLQRLAPESGAYLNEANAEDPNWQQDFYGVNYPQLLKIKDKYDPAGFFYATTAVGSERWKPQPDGRLCEAQPNVKIGL